MAGIKTYRLLGFLLLSVFLFGMLSCQQKGKENIDVNIFFSAEKLTEDNNNFYAENDSSIIFKGAEFRSNLTSLTGDFSYVTSPKNQYSIGINIPKVRPENYVEISIWRKGADSKSHLIAGSVTPDLFYRSTNQATVSLDGWEKLELTFFLPPNYTDKELKVYVWNSSKDTVFFDDLSINIKERKQYPDYKEAAIYVEVDTSMYLKLLETRKKAFESGVLQSEDEDWVKGFIIGNNEMMKTKLRLKGDWLDHLHGDKWSFRLKLKSGFTWNRLKVFSLHNPITRHGVDEWFLHQVLLSQDVLTTRYGFTPTYFYGRNIGIYAWEEHFTKQLIESQNKREGPIVRFYEDVYWDQIRGKKSGIDSILIPYFEAAAIKPFSTGKIVEDSVAFGQFLIAQNLLFQYKHRTKLASEIFNIDALAKYFAMMDVFQAHHSLIWHNQRFYYNPVLSKLEPILFDAYTEDGSFNWVSRSMTGDVKYNSVETLDDQFLMMRELFNDIKLLNKYIDYLELYSSPEFLTKVNLQFSDEAIRYDSLVQLEFPDLQLNIATLYENADNIRNDLPAFKQKIKERLSKNEKWLNISKKKKEFTVGLEGYFTKNLVQAYKMKRQGDSTLIRVVNYYTDPILLLGFGTTNKKIKEFLHPEPELKGYQYLDKVDYECWIYTLSDYLFVMAGGGQETIAIEIMPWPEPDGKETPLQALLRSNTFPDSALVESVMDNKIFVKNGKIVIDHPIVIPEGFELYVKPGTYINLVNKAFIISYSPVYLTGTNEAPIIVTSSDFSAMGFTVLQAGERSKIEYTRFENMNTLDYKGWTLTGAVNFYESDVDIINTTFYRNQCEDALNTIRSDFKVDNSTFEYIFGDAFDSDFSTGLIDGAHFKTIGNDAIDFSGSRILIKNVLIEDALDKGISGGEESFLTVENTIIKRAGIGVASKDLSVVKFENGEIEDCKYGLVLLQKKPEYGSATVVFSNSKIIKPETEMLIEKGSVVEKDGKTIKGKKEKLADIFYE